MARSISIGAVSMGVLVLGLLVVAAGAIDFDKFKHCKECIDAGFGWCPNMRRCGGFANNRCRGDVTDTRRSPAEEKAFMDRVNAQQPNRGAPPPPPPPPQQQQRNNAGGSAGGNPLAPGKLVEFAMGIEKHLTGHSLKTQLIVFTNGVYSEETKPLKKAAKKLRSRALVVRIVAKDYAKVFERFGFKLGKTRLPQFAIADFSRDAGLEVYRRTEQTAAARKAVELTPTREGVAKVIAFMEAFDKGELPLHIRSQAMPPNRYRFPPYPSGAVLPVVGDNLPAIAMDKHHATLLFAFMPGCGHCKNFNETFYALSSAFAMRCHFAIMDGTQNDVDHPTVTFGKGYPSIWFFGKHSKLNPTQHNERDRSKKGFALWLDAQLKKDDALNAAANSKRSGSGSGGGSGSGDDDDTVFADDDDEEDDDSEYQRPTKDTPASPPPPPPPAPKKPAPAAPAPAATKPKPNAAPTAAAAAATPDDTLWAANERLDLSG